MGNLRTVLTALLVLGILSVIILTWGSVGSAAMTLGLLLAGALLLHRKLLKDQDEGDYDSEMY